MYATSQRAIDASVGTLHSFLQDLFAGNSCTLFHPTFGGCAAFFFQMTSRAACDSVLLERAKRDASLAKVSPELERLPSPLPSGVLGLASSILSPKELEITEGYSTLGLLEDLRSRRVSVEEVTRAFLRRAALAHATTNCLTQLVWDEALLRAKELDALSEPCGALYGLPVSVKEHLGMVGTGVATNASFVGWIGREHDSTPIVDSLWAEGCVFIARTNQPQAVMSLETDSVVYGRTVNPHNRELTPGGSSGGEAVLLAMRGSMLGVGTDIGGSVRCPAGHVGVYGFKPTSKRLSARGIRHYEHGSVHVFGTPGPLANDREGLRLLMKVGITAKPWTVDPTITVMDWNPYRFSRPLKIAVQWWDGVVMPHPPMTRALNEVVQACRKAGMHIEKWNCDELDHAKSWETLSALYWVDGGEGLMSLLGSSGEELLPLTKFTLQQQRHVKKMSEEELSQRLAERSEFQAKYAKAWDSTAEEDGEAVDVILCPPSFGAASPHEQSRYWGYTSVWNFLDYPAAVFPVTSVDPERDVRDESYQPRNQQDRFVHDLYRPEIYAGMPIGVQIVGRRHCDEKVLAALAMIERAMGRD